MEEYISKKLKGYRASHRNRWIAKRALNLTDSEFTLFEFLLDITDFDTRHDKFGCFEYIAEDVADVFGVSRRTINRRFKSLLSLKLIKKSDPKRNLYKVPNFQRYVSDIGIKGKATDYVKEEKRNGNSFDIIIKNMTKEKRKTDKSDAESNQQSQNKASLNSKGLGLSKYASKVDVCLSKEDEDNISNLLDQNNSIL